MRKDKKLLLTPILYFFMLCFLVIILFSVLDTELFWLVIGTVCVAFCLYVITFKSTLFRSKEDSHKIEQKLGRIQLKQRLTDIDSLWSRVVKRIKVSRLSHKGDPLYTLPWYLMLGEESSGRTSALQQSNVAVSLLEDAGSAIEDSALPVWWLLDGTIVIEPPSRYSVPVTEMDKIEGKHFFSRFARYRPKQPLDGVVVTCPADKLMRGRPEEIKTYAAQLRNRLSELSQICGIRFPVYIMITKTDQVAGMSRFFDFFPSAMSAQSMGGLVDERTGSSVVEQVDSVMLGINRKLKELRLAMLSDIRIEELSPSAYLFPEELETLHLNLTLFSFSLLDPAYFIDAPIFRGLHFTSARQNGKSLSNLVAPIIDEKVNDSPVPESRSLFLQGFFGRVLKKEKNRVLSTGRSINISRIRKNLGYSGILLASFFIAMLGTASFVSNMSGMTESDSRLPPALTLHNSLAENLATLNQYREAILHLKRENDNSWIPTMGLDQSRKVESRLSEDYSKKFREIFLTPFEKQLSSNLENMQSSSNAKDIAEYVDFLSKRISLQKSIIGAKANLDTIYSMKQPNFSFMIRQIGVKDTDARTATLLKDSYLAYLVWNSNRNYIGNDIEVDLKRLRSLIEGEDIGLDWLISWANMQEELRIIKRQDYWELLSITDGSSKAKTVASAFTEAGWERIKGFIKSIELAVEDETVVHEKKKVFLKSYYQAYIDEWVSLLTNFDLGSTDWIGRERRKALALKIASDQSPYERLMQDLEENMSAVFEISSLIGERLPSWLLVASRYRALANREYQSSLDDEASLVDRIVSKGASALVRASAVARDIKSREDILVEDKDAAQLIKAYKSTLTQMADKAQSSETAYELVKANYLENRTARRKPEQFMNLNIWSIGRLKESLTYRSDDENVFWDLLEGQALAIWDVSLRETEYYLENVWKTEVMTTVDEHSGWKRIDALQGREGSIWLFKENYAKAFLKKNESYHSSSLYGKEVQFSKMFLDTLNSGWLSRHRIDSPYILTLLTLPTDVNKGSLKQPHMTQLKVSCVDGDIDIKNYNFPTRRTLNWTPEKCSNVMLRIFVGNTVLTKKYTGYNAFAKFVRDFRHGRHVFTHEDFPDSQAQLALYRIDSITVGYKLEGIDQVLELASKQSSKIPLRITHEVAPLQFAFQ